MYEVRVLFNLVSLLQNLAVSEFTDSISPVGFVGFSDTGFTGSFTKVFGNSSLCVSKSCE